MSDQHELSVTRFIEAPPETVYRVWTERTEEWWAPKPWVTRIVEQDLRAGGRSAIEMEGPQGERHPGEGVFLEVVPGERIVFTNAFTAGWQPKTGMDSDCDFAMVAIVTFEPEGTGTRYTARVRHWDEDAQNKHEAMGFQEGWGIVAAQLAALAEAEAARPPVHA
ncbi:MAG TPA: SRPBCC family protein [Allosphingosinicella sp.]|nr:SRPBCC family protein [Allosphingosinicella sp.]